MWIIGRVDSPHFGAASLIVFASCRGALQTPHRFLASLRVPIFEKSTREHAAPSCGVWCCSGNHVFLHHAAYRCLGEAGERNYRISTHIQHSHI